MIPAANKVLRPCKVFLKSKWDAIFQKGSQEIVGKPSPAFAIPLSRSALFAEAMSRFWGFLGPPEDVTQFSMLCSVGA